MPEPEALIPEANARALPRATSATEPEVQTYDGSLAAVRTQRELERAASKNALHKRN